MPLILIVKPSNSRLSTLFQFLNDNSLLNFLNELKSLINSLLSLFTIVLDCLLTKMLNNSLTSQSLSILIQNTNGLSNHRNELITALKVKRIDLALISTTRFTTHTKFLIPGNNIITSNHLDNTVHAGTAISIKSSLKYTPCPSVNENSV